MQCLCRNNSVVLLNVRRRKEKGKSRKGRVHLTPDLPEESNTLVQLPGRDRLSYHHHLFPFYSYSSTCSSSSSSSLNYYFASVFTVENIYEIQDIIPAQPNLIPLSDCSFTEDAVTKVLDKIKVNKTLDLDYIAPTIWKRQKIKSANHLRYYPINPLILEESQTFGTWQILRSYNKEGDKALPNSYKPISLTSVVCKLMETLLRDRIGSLKERGLECVDASWSTG